MQEQIGIQMQNVQSVESFGLDNQDTNSTRSAVKDSAPSVFLNEYAELKQIMKQKGLFDKQPRAVRGVGRPSTARS